LALFLLVLLSCSENKNSDSGALTYSEFQNKLKLNMNYDALISSFGDPSKDAGSGIHIYVFPMIDSTEIWIGYTDRILYARRVDKDHQFLENVKFLNSIGTITGSDIRMCACCGGWYIQIDGINYEFDSLPVDSKIDLSAEKFPVSVKIDWQLSDVPACPDKRIVIQKISRQ
jgi:hypothetical protein